MTYVILHGTLYDIEGRMNDGALLCFVGNGKRDTPYDYRKEFTTMSEEALVLGNYYSDEENIPGWKDSAEWNDRRRKFVSSRWLELIDIVENQLKENDRMDIDLIDYFNPDSNGKSDPMDIVDRFSEKMKSEISNGTMDFKKLIHMMDYIED